MSAAVLALVMLAPATPGCRERALDIKAAPERELPRAPEPPPAPPGKVVNSLVGHAGEEVTIAGTLVAKPRPRIASTQPGKVPIFVDVEGSHLEIAAHVARRPDCTGSLYLTGRVIVAVGMAKEGTTEGAYAEPQLDVERWRCR